MSTREIAQACRCQLLTGSYVGARRSCDCIDASHCQLTIVQRKQLKDHLKVVAALHRNRREYGQQTVEMNLPK